MANPTSLSEGDFNALTLVNLNNVSGVSTLIGSTFYFAGRVKGTNQIAFYADVDGVPTLTESRALYLSLGGVDLGKSSTRSYYTYDIGKDPQNNIWELTITGSAGNTCKFKKAGIGGENPFA